jgi:hypothetical protein
MAGFCELVTSLQALILGILTAKWPIVSGGHLKNSRFLETGAVDRVRSALRDRCGSLLVEQVPLSAKIGRGFAFEGSHQLSPALGPFL